MSVMSTMQVKFVLTSAWNASRLTSAGLESATGCCVPALRKTQSRLGNVVLILWPLVSFTVGTWLRAMPVTPSDE